MSQDPHKTREARNYENPIPSREFILELLADLGQPTSFKHIAKYLKLDTEQDLDALSKRLGAMVRDGQLVRDRRNVFAIASKVDLPRGKVSVHPEGYGFLLVEGDEDIFFTQRELRQVMHGDVIIARVRGNNRRGKTEGEIVEVVERNTQQLVGRYYIENGVQLLEPLNKRINHEVIIDGLKIKCEPGQIVVADVTQQPSLHGVVKATIVELLGDHLTPGIEVDIALRNHDIPHDWPDEVVAEADQMPIEVTDADKKDRFDLTELPFVTIDGEDARDFDDAVYCEQHEVEGWRLYVAIADVGHYVEPQSHLDISAIDRATSVYFPQYVVPMLPSKLSNGLCSLNPLTDRLVMVCEMVIRPDGIVTQYDFYEGFIHSHARLTYEQVAAAISTGTLDVTSENMDSPSMIMESNREAVEENIQELENLYEVLVKKRQKRGAIEFESTEVQFQFSDEGRIDAIVPRGRNKAHRIIEECMLCANVSAARLVESQERPGLFRVHEPPEVEKLQALEAFLQQFGVRFKAGENVHPSDYQAITAQLRKRQNGHVLQMALLRSMNQAVYQPENKGHFGLAYDEYTHFTSPIRRYPDLLTHRLIKACIQSDGKHTLRLGRKTNKKHYPYDVAQMVELGVITSSAERRADAAVYEVLDFLKCDYISDRVGDVLPGVVTGVAKFGLFVELTDVFVEGLVHVSSLMGDYYRYDQGMQVLSGERTGEVYGMGDVVEAQIIRVNVDERKIDFELVSHTPIGNRTSVRSGAKTGSKSGGGQSKGGFKDKNRGNSNKSSGGQADRSDKNRDDKKFGKKSGKKNTSKSGQRRKKIKLPGATSSASGVAQSGKTQKKASGQSSSSSESSATKKPKKPKGPKTRRQRT